MRRQERDRTRLRTAALAGGALAAWSLCAVLAAPPKLASQKTPAPSEVKAPPQAATNAAVPKTNAVPSATRQNPYRSIALRNPFGLRPVPPPNPKPKPEPKKPEPPDNSQLKLSGITTLLGKRAMFVLIKPGKTNLYSGLVREGERDSVITNLEVLKIDPKGGVVTVRYAGKELALNFKEHGLAPPKPTAAASKKGGTRSPPRPVLTTSARRTAASRTASGARRVYAGRTVYTAPSSAARNSALRPSSPAALRSALSQRRGASSSAARNAAKPAVSLQEQIETMKRQAEMARQQGIPMPPLPIAPTGGSQPPSLPGL